MEQNKKPQYVGSVLSRADSLVRGINLPDFIKAKILLNDQDLAIIAANSKNGKTRLEIKEGRDGRWYMVIDTYDGSKVGADRPQTTEQLDNTPISDIELPF